MRKAVLSRVERRDALALAALALLVRVPSLDVQSFDRDEAFSVGHILQPGLIDTLEFVPGETSPPLYYVLLWGWSTVFGHGEVGTRSLSALVGAATAPVAYELGRTLVSRRVGLIAGTLVAVNPLLFWFSQEARPYSLLVFLCTLSLLFFVRALEDPTRGRLTGWVIASVLAFATHWFAAFLVAAQALWLLMAGRDRRAAARATIAAAAVAAPLAPLLLHQAGHGRGDWIGTIGLGERLKGTGEQFLAGATASKIAPAAAFAGALVCTGVLLLALRGDQRERRGGLLALGIGGAAVVIPLALAPVGPDYVLDKNLLPALVPLALAAAAGMGARRAGATGIATAVALCGLSLGIVAAVTFDPKLQRYDWRGAVRAMGETSGPRAVVAPYNADASLEIYLPDSQLLEDRTARVSEVVVLGWADPHAIRLPSRFELAGRRQLTSVPMARFRADRPGSVRRRALVTIEVGGACNPSPDAVGCEQSMVLLQR